MKFDYKYPGMKSLLAGSFYQCWEEFDGRSADEVLNEALSESSVIELERAIRELSEIFSMLG